MKSFPLEIVTPDGSFFNGESECVVVRTISGEVGIMADHVDYLNALGMGEARISVEGTVRRASCIGGMISVSSGKVRIVATTFEWADEIDLARAEAAKARAEEALKAMQKEDQSFALMNAKLKRALVRIMSGE